MHVIPFEEVLLKRIVHRAQVRHIRVARNGQRPVCATFEREFRPHYTA